MRLGAHGAHVIGGQDDQVHRDRVIPSGLVGVRAGNWAEFDAATIMGPGVFPGSVETWILGYDVQEDVLNPFWMRHPNDAHEFGAGGGEWALGGRNFPGPGVYSGRYGTLAGAGLYTVGRDGALVTKPDFHATVGIEVRMTSGEWFGFGASVFVAYNDGLLVHRRPDGVTVCSDLALGGEIPVAVVGSHWQRVCRGADGHAYLLEWQDWSSRLVVHAIGSTRGWIVSSGDHDFNPDLCAMADGTLRVVSSYGRGERPNEVQDYRVSVFAETVDLTPPVTPPVDPPVDPVEPPVDPPVDQPTNPNPDPEPEPEPPVTPEPDMKQTVSIEAVRGFVVEEKPHPDAGRVALQRGDGKYFKVDRISGATSWTDGPPTGWEGFVPSGSSYTAVMDDGSALIFPKGGAFA